MEMLIIRHSAKIINVQSNSMSMQCKAMQYTHNTIIIHIHRTKDTQAMQCNTNTETNSDTIQIQWKYNIIQYNALQYKCNTQKNINAKGQNTDTKKKTTH